MANSGEGVSTTYQLPLGGAEPLSIRQLQVMGHYEFDRPSRIFERLDQADIAADDQKKEEIAIADDRRRRPAEEKIRSVAPGKG